MEEVCDKYPQLKPMLSDFVATILLHKPDDVFSFANDYFTQFHPQPTIVSQKSENLLPIVINGPSGVGKGTRT
jgi:hypothetical protein